MVKGDFPRADVPTVVVRQALREKVASADELPRQLITPRRLATDPRFPGKATAIVGMRRVGKTTLIQQLRRERVASGLPAANVPYISFEDERLEGLDTTALSFLVNEYDRLHPAARDRGPVVWHLDEAHLAPGWERFARRLLDTPGTEVVVSGSSAALLSREVATSLRGRGWEVPLHPFSFAEFLTHHDLGIPDEIERLSRAGRSRTESAFLRWLVTGGFPEAQGLPVDRRHWLLRAYVDIAVLRDVIERHRVRSPDALTFLVRQLLSAPAALFSVERFHHTLRSRGYRVSRATIHAFLAHLEDSFLFRFVSMASGSERRRAVNPRKAYPADTGLIPVFERLGRSNRGRLLETAVFIELQRRRVEVSYVHTPGRREVDFLSRAADGTLELIQVAADLHDPVTARREFTALAEAREMFPAARQRILTLTADPLPFEPPPGVETGPAWKWMLEAAESSRLTRTSMGRESAPARPDLSE